MTLKCNGASTQWVSPVPLGITSGCNSLFFHLEPSNTRCIHAVFPVNQTVLLNLLTHHTWRIEFLGLEFNI